VYKRQTYGNDVTLRIRIYAPANASASGELYLNEVVCKIVKVDGSNWLYYDGDSETEVAVRERNNKDGGEIELLTSDVEDIYNSNLVFKGGLWSDSGLSVPTQNWRNARGDGGTVAEILEAMLTREHFYPSQTLAITLYAPYDSFSIIDTLKEINNSHRLFMPKRADYDSKYGRWEMEAIELSNDMTRAVVKTIGHPGETTTDYAFDGDADSNAQNLEIEDIIPANARVVDVVLITTEAWDDGIDMAAGNASAGTQYITATAMETLADIGQPSLGQWPDVNINAAATSVWIQGNPDNNWEDITTGECSLIVTYIDNDPLK